MARLSQRNLHEMSERRQWMTKRQDYKTHAATFRADGQKVQFVHQLDDLEMRDHKVATKVHNEIEASKQREEVEGEQQRNQKIKAVQMENITNVINKQSQSVKEKKFNQLMDNANYYASVKIPDMVEPRDLSGERRK